MAAGSDKTCNDTPHLAIRGDCLDVLTSLCPLEPATVDVLLTDPPYNTGARRSYHDAYGSDWPTWIKARLAAASATLKDTGLAAVCIGPDELWRLKTVMDEVFGVRNHLTTITWVGRGSPASQFTSGGLDHILVYAKKRTALSGRQWREPHGPAAELVDLARTTWARSGTEAAERAVATWKKDHPDIPAGLGPYRHVDEHGRLWRAGPLDKPISAVAGQHYEIVHPATGQPCPTPANGWRMKAEQFELWDAEGRIAWPADHTTPPRRRIWLDESVGVPPSEVFHHERHLETRRLDRMLCGHRFDGPKDVGVLTRWLRMWTGPDSVVLDIFAGSGSTGEAVMALNASDGGHRRAILITNHESFDDVLVPRFVAVCDGVRPDGTPWDEMIPGARIEFVRAQTSP